MTPSITSKIGVCDIPPPYYVYMSLLIPVILCFLPLLLDLSVDHNVYGNIDDIPIYSSLQSTAFQFCLIGCLGASIPIISDLAVDSFCPSPSEAITTEKAAVWTLLLSSLIANGIIVSNVFTRSISKIGYWACSTSFSSCLVYAAGALLLNKYGPKIWRWKCLLPIVFILWISEILLPFQLFVLSNNSKNSINNICFIFYSISCCLFIYSCIRWMKFIILKYKTIPLLLTTDEIYCTLNMIAMLSLLIIMWYFKMCDCSIVSLEATIQTITSYQYIMTIFVLATVILNCRYIRERITLSQTRRELDSKNILVGYFSNEVRTPLNSLCIGLQVLKKEILRLRRDDDHNIPLLVDDLQGSCDCAVDILNDLLLYTNLENSNNIEIKIKSIPVIPFIRKIVQKQMSNARRKGVNLRLVLPEHSIFNHHVEDIDIKVDEEKLTQVIRGLISNAIDCTSKHDNVTVAVSIVTMNDCKDVPSNRNSSVKPMEYMLQVLVKDGGCLISQEEHDRVFNNRDSFTTGVLESKEGKLLGLWISKRIMQLHKGSLFSLSNEDSHGSTYVANIPMEFVSSMDSTMRAAVSHITSASDDYNYANKNSITSNQHIQYNKHYNNYSSSSGKNNNITNKSFNASSSFLVAAATAAKVSSFSFSKQSSSFVRSSTQYRSFGQIQAPTSSPIQPYDRRNSTRSEAEGDSKSDVSVKSFSSSNSNNNQFQEPINSIIDIITEDTHLELKTTNKSYLSSIHNNNHTPHNTSSKSIKLSPRSTTTATTTTTSALIIGGIRKCHSIACNIPIKTTAIRSPRIHIHNRHKSFHTALSRGSSGGSGCGDGSGGGGGSDIRPPKLAHESNFNTLIPLIQNAPDNFLFDNYGRVLIVDDDAMSRKMLSRLLQGQCERTVEAEDGVIAVGKMKISLDIGGELFDLVLMDYQMPNMDGPEAAKCMREMGYKGPIIGVIGNHLPVHIQSFISHGADRVLAKPLSFDLLKRTLLDMSSCNNEPQQHLE